MELTFGFTRLLVADFKACFRFYQDVLGFQAGFGTENDTYADFQTGEVTIALFDKQEMNDAVHTGHLPTDVVSQDKVCLVFSVQDVNAACQELKARGVTLVTEPADHADWGIRTAHFRDPEGNLIEINQPLGR